MVPAPVVHYNSRPFPSRIQGPLSTTYRSIKAVNSSINGEHFSGRHHFSPRLSDVWLVLAKFQTFQGLLLILEKHLEDFECFEIESHLKPVLNSKLFAGSILEITH